MDISKARVRRIRQCRMDEFYDKVMLVIRTDDAKEKVEELLARYYKEIFYRMAELGVSPTKDRRVRELDERLDILGNFKEEDFVALAKKYIRGYDNAKSADANWSQVIWDYILTEARRPICQIAA